MARQLVVQQLKKRLMKLSRQQTGQTEQWGGRSREDRNLELKQARRLYRVREGKLQALVTGRS